MRSLLTEGGGRGGRGEGRGGGLGGGRAETRSNFPDYRTPPPPPPPNHTSLRSYRENVSDVFTCLPPHSLHRVCVCVGGGGGWGGGGVGVVQ